MRLKLKPWADSSKIWSQVKWNWLYRHCNRSYGLCSAKTYKLIGLPGIVELIESDPIRPMIDPTSRYKTTYPIKLKLGIVMTYSAMSLLLNSSIRVWIHLGEWNSSNASFFPKEPMQQRPCWSASWAGSADQLWIMVRSAEKQLLELQHLDVGDKRWRWRIWRNSKRGD